MELDSASAQFRDVHGSASGGHGSASASGGCGSESGGHGSANDFRGSASDLDEWATVRESENENDGCELEHVLLEIVTVAALVESESESDVHENSRKMIARGIAWGAANATGDCAHEIEIEGDEYHIDEN